MKLKAFQQIALMLVTGVVGLCIGIAVMWNGPRTSAATVSGTDLILHEGVTATCEHAGVRDYWENPATNVYYSDANGVNVIDGDLETWKVIPQVEHKTNENCYHAHENPTCAKEGHQAYYSCAYGCGAIFTDIECKHEVTMVDVTLPKIAHTLNYVAHEDATCEHDGHEAHYVCAVCGATFKDAAGQISFNPIIKTQHNLIHHDAVAATCEQSGNIAYDECATCHRKFDANGNELTDGAEVLPAKGHCCSGNYYHAAKARTCTEDGNPEYWECNDCGKYFYDAALTHEMNPSVLDAYKATGHGEYILVYAPENRVDDTVPYRSYVGDLNGYVTYYKVCEHGCGDIKGYQQVRGYANLIDDGTAIYSYEIDANNQLVDVYTVNKTKLTDNSVAIKIDVAVNCSIYSNYAQYDQDGNLIATVNDFTDAVVEVSPDYVLTLNVQFDTEPSDGDYFVWKFDWDGDGIYEQTIKVVIAA